MPSATKAGTSVHTALLVGLQAKPGRKPPSRSSLKAVYRSLSKSQPRSLGTRSNSDRRPSGSSTPSRTMPAGKRT